MYYVIKNNKLIEWSDSLSALDTPDDTQTLDGVLQSVYNTDPGKYQVIDGVLTDVSDTEEYKAAALEKAKAAKIAENEQKRNVDFIPTSLGLLKTQTPLGDLKTALPLYDKIAAANNGLPAGAVRLYDAQGNVSLSPALTLEQYNAMTVELASAYLAIDAKSTQYTQAILAAQSIEELEEIVVDYTVTADTAPKNQDTEAQ